MRSQQHPYTSFVTLAAALLLLAGCDKAPPPVANIPPLANQPVEVVDSTLGKPYVTMPVADGEDRSYALPGGVMLVRTSQGKAIFFTLRLKKAVPTAVEAVKQAGFDAPDSPTNPGSRRTWSGKFGKASFTQISASGRPGQGFSIISAQAQ